MDQTEYKKTAIAVALRKLLVTDNMFSICAIKSIATMAGVSLNREDLLVFEAMHCVHYNDMPHTFRVELKHRVLKQFVDAGISDVIVEVQPDPVPQSERKSFLKRLGW